VLTVNPLQANVVVGLQQQFTAIISGGGNQAVNWQVNGIPGGNTTVGMISAGGLYTAPGSVPAPAKVTVKAISQVDNTVTGTATVTVIAQLGVSISPSGSVTISTGGTQPFTATVVGDPLNQGVTWNLTCISDVESGGTPDCDGKSGDDGDGDISTLSNVTSFSVTFNAAPGNGGKCDENVADCVLTLTATTVATDGSGAQTATVTITVP
jgi:hypothetical protein